MVVSEAQPSATRGNETVTFLFTAKSQPSRYRGWRFDGLKSKVKKQNKNKVLQEKFQYYREGVFEVLSITDSLLAQNN